MLRWQTIRWQTKRKDVKVFCKQGQQRKRDKRDKKRDKREIKKDKRRKKQIKAKRKRKKCAKHLVKQIKCCTFATANQKWCHGALDEWLSQRSAKPSTAVRIRQAPHKSNQQCWLLFCYSITSTFLHVFSIRLSAALRHIKILFHIVSIVVSPQPKAQTYRPPTPQQLRTPTPSWKREGAIARYR